MKPLAMVGVYAVPMRGVAHTAESLKRWKLVDGFIDWRGERAGEPEKPASKPLQIIYERLQELAKGDAR